MLNKKAKPINILLLQLLIEQLDSLLAILNQGVYILLGVSAIATLEYFAGAVSEELFQLLLSLGTLQLLGLPRHHYFVEFQFGDLPVQNILFHGVLGY
jgi:hypothetical protein